MSFLKSFFYIIIKGYFAIKAYAFILQSLSDYSVITIFLHYKHYLITAGNSPFYQFAVPTSRRKSIFLKTCLRASTTLIVFLFYYYPYFIRSLCINFFSFSFTEGCQLWAQ